MLRLDVNFAAVDVADEAFDVGVGRISEDDYRVLTRIILKIYTVFESNRKGLIQQYCERSELR